eukprot:CAMPEP_0179851266 /NCGR_PEP_ID=MMETSP0982-20121206/8157_1 /TAXON_ID=483367 /ORGANISM="non described non described, Strain CCMP 2436" /LENGTH=120 /DNA_ID=CAMNT_0021736771 /DNA_START=207 /DNA_END=571 /DNA_ORIENTATION=+
MLSRYIALSSLVAVCELTPRVQMSSRHPGRVFARVTAWRPRADGAPPPEESVSRARGSKSSSSRSCFIPRIAAAAARSRVGASGKGKVDPGPGELLAAAAGASAPGYIKERSAPPERRAA